LRSGFLDEPRAAGVEITNSLTDIKSSAIAELPLTGLQHEKMMGFDDEVLSLSRASKVLESPD